MIGTFHFNIPYISSYGGSAGVEFFVSSLSLHLYMKNEWVFLNSIKKTVNTHERSVLHKDSIPHVVRLQRQHL
jgi:hypothetical protein